ncbi:multidrug efflux MFS transporter periplasmic adaptor subunit EmrA [Thorsellia anophelis]|uniref:Membrane fusion protein, multidrug efflux system n=1 Tax=Thorsellia anophelis DSM 18579 TaxID=1123402 RepID=A0A1I0DHH8_9GAMM|nr:multidrug efflux MFS transporter periplasmic adaptor subunit EmrA [Thorsellia anophelis]SET31485.1 membrane fusion protein, multidrug efflux system [Thorsellia anophelis DSM 18579]
MSNEHTSTSNKIDLHTKENSAENILNKDKLAKTSEVSKKIKRKVAFSILILTIIILLGFYLFHWYHTGRFEVETDNAYVSGNQVQIMSEISGTVSSIHVDNTDFVNEGDVLVQLDKTDAEQSFEKAQALLATQVRQAHQSVISLKQNQANIEEKTIALQQAQSDLARRQALSQSNAIGKEELQHARDAVTLAEASLESAKAQYNANQALVLDTPIEKQPGVVKAATELKEAWLALQRTTITSPVTGYVSKRSVQVGAQIAPNTPLMAIISADNLWIDANFKETQLNQMRIGQNAKITTDIYGDKVVFNGKIKGIEMGTGSAFSLLPAQNASGNWIKIVQRVPVRIELDANELKQYPLRIGLSSTVVVETKDQSGPILASKHPDGALYKVSQGEIDMTSINALINQIIKENG